jgi:hypothetical protein
MAVSWLEGDVGKRAPCGVTARKKTVAGAVPVGKLFAEKPAEAGAAS